MTELVVFEESLIHYPGTRFLTGRWQGHDVILTPASPSLQADAPLVGAEAVDKYIAFPADHANMLAWERQLAPEPRLIALNQSGYGQGFGAGNRIVVAWEDVPLLADPTTFGGWDGIYRAMTQASVPFWFIQQSIVRELIPEGVDQDQYPGIGHTGGYGPKELLRSGLFAFASQGGYTRYTLPIGADADHAIVVGHDEESLAKSIGFNRLAITEASDYTKFTVDTSSLFDFPVVPSPAERKHLLGTFQGRRFQITNIVPGRAGFEFEFAEDEVLLLGWKYWQACTVHKELYDHTLKVRNGRPFDYELSLDETPAAMPPRELLFYLVVLLEVMGLPAGAVTSAGPNIGFAKRSDYRGDLHQLWMQVNSCASILHHFGAMLSVHSADGAWASTGKGPGVDEILEDATAGRAELKVADVYQELLWDVLATSSKTGERELFLEAWRRTHEAARHLATVYERILAGRRPADAQAFLASPSGQERISGQYGADTLQLVQGVIGYGLPLFKLASDLLASVDVSNPRATDELFRRFMFLTFRNLRPQLFHIMSSDGWQRLAQAVERATIARIGPMDWIRGLP